MENELGRVSLRRTSQGWGFSSELALEDHIWSNLESLFHLKGFQRQFMVMGEVCDILALNEDRQLAILELKNTEDRYIVQQLTRYYANLIEEKPFADRIDYEKPIRLIAIAPTFHRHNLIDRQFSRLSLEFIQFEITEADQFYLDLKPDDAKGAVIRSALPFQEVQWAEDNEVALEVPELLLNWLGGCSPADQEAFLMVRRQILSFHPRMQEIVGKNSIQYGAGKTKLCAEVLFSRSDRRPVLFLWLTLPNCLKNMNKSERIGRLRVWVRDGNATHLGHIPKGLGKMRLEEEWNAIPRDKWPRKALSWSLTHDSMMPVLFRHYAHSVVGEENGEMSLQEITQVALEKWLKRLGS